MFTLRTLDRIIQSVSGKAQVIIVWRSESALELATRLKYPVPALSERPEHCWQWPRPIFMFSFFLCEFTVEWKGKYFTKCDFKAHKQIKYLV